MTNISYADLRQNLARTLDQVVEGNLPVVVTRQAGKGNVVMLSEAEFSGWQETVHLLSSPQNAAALLRSIQQANGGAVTTRELPPVEAIDDP